MPEPPSSLAERVARVKSASLCDAMRRLRPHRAHVLDLVSPTPGRALWGFAATMLFVPVRADVDTKDAYGFERRLAEAVGPDGRGKIVVMAVAGAPDAAVAGGIRLAMVERTGAAGLVTNARLRDFDEAAARPLVCYARGETVFAGSAEIMPVAANLAVALDGATVLPGDFVYADGAGTVVVPAADLDRALDLAAAIEAEDAERLRTASGA